jgi:hypothetical protein
MMIIPGDSIPRDASCIINEKVDVTMKRHLLKRILDAIKMSLSHGFGYLYQKRQVIVYVMLITMAVIYLVYVLGYSSNWALIVSETRGGNFYRASQKANQLMFQLALILVLINMLLLGFGSMSRKKFYLSNIVLSILSFVMMIVSAVITYYYNGVLSRMYARLTEEEIDPDLYLFHGAGAKSFEVFEIGNVLAIFMIASAVIGLVFLIGKMKAQKERAKLIQGMVASYER